MSILTNMQDNQNYILGICQTLSMKGKKPTVALIRSLADRPLMIPQVIKVLQTWRQNPKVVSPAKTTDKLGIVQSKLALEQRVDELEQQMIKISAQLEALLKLS